MCLVIGSMSIAFIFMLGVFFALFWVHLFPHTRVCGLCRGGCSSFLVVCWDVFMVLGFLSTSSMHEIIG